MLKTRIDGVGSALPKTIVTNNDLALRLDTTDAWIVERTGIHQRHIASLEETTVSLGIKAACAALENAEISPEAIDLVLLATSSPDYTFPASATMIQAGLGITQGLAFDLQAVCSGFVYALTVADSLLKTGQAKNALVIGSETFSRLLDWTDRSTCVLFGDGAGAVVLSAQEDSGLGIKQRGVHHTLLRSDGRFTKKLYVDGGVSTSGHIGHLRMDGRDVLRHAVENMSQTITSLLAQSGLEKEDIAWYIPHQANIRIMEGVARKLDLPLKRVITTVHTHANTSAASIPLALEETAKQGSLKKGDLVLMVAMGGGFTWGGTLVRW